MTERSGIVLGYRWLTELGQQLVSTPTSSDRSLLHQNVQPYEICDLNLTITAPNAVGNYQLEIDLVEEGITWFRAKGSKTIRVQVNITAITPQDELEKQRQLEAVISSYQQAMEAQGNCPDLYSELENLLAKAYFELGNVQCQLGQLDAATKNCQKAIAVDPQNFWAYWNLGDIAKAQGRWQEAVEYYKRATEIKPDYANAQVELENAQRLLAEHRK